jgi:hypothetical protein
VEKICPNLLCPDLGKNAADLRIEAKICNNPHGSVADPYPAAFHGRSKHLVKKNESGYQQTTALSGFAATVFGGEPYGHHGV